MADEPKTDSASPIKDASVDVDSKSDTNDTVADVKVGGAAEPQKQPAFGKAFLRAVPILGTSAPCPRFDVGPRSDACPHFSTPILFTICPQATSCASAWPTMAFR